MKNAIDLLLFLICTSIVFFVDNYILILLITGVVFSLNIICKIKYNELANIYAKIIVFIMLTVLINLIIDGFEKAVLLGIKLIIVCNMTVIYSKKITSMKLADAIENLLYPLKLFRLNIKDVSMIICIAITFIPIFNKEIRELKNNLKAKSCRINIKCLKAILLPFFMSVLKKIDDIDKTLKVKAYVQ